MMALGHHRANFSWALNKYNSTDDPSEREKFARFMAKYLKGGCADGFDPEEITQGQSYPADEVTKYDNAPTLSDVAEKTEDEVKKEFAHKVDTINATRLGTGKECVYAYGYKCAPDRLKIGQTETDCVQRIVQQINTSTPDQPVLYIEIRTDRCRALERAMHAVLEHRGKKLLGGGDEWFKTSPAEVLEIYEFVTKVPA